MSEKSALIDAVLRTGALSEVYTQDLESDEEPAKAATPVKPNPLHPAAELRQRIWAKVKELAPEATTRETVEAFIKERTGMDLHPDLYGAVLATPGRARMSESIYIRLSNIMDDLDRLSRHVEPPAIQLALEQIVERLENLIEETIGMEGRQDG